MASFLIGDLLISVRDNLVLDRPSVTETVAAPVLPRPSRHADVIRTVLITLAAVIVTLGVFEVCARLLVIAAVPRQAHNPEFDAKFVVAKSPIPADAGRPAIFAGGSYVRTGIYGELLRSLLQEHGITIYPKNLGTSASSILEHMTLLTTAVDSCKGQTPVVFYDLRQESFSKGFQQNQDLNSSNKFLECYMGRKYAIAHPNLLQRLQLFIEDHSCLVRQRGFLRGKLINLVPVLCRFDKEYENAMVRRDNSSSILPVSAMGTILVPIFSNSRFDQFFQEFAGDEHGDLVHWNGMDWSDDWLNMVKTYCRQKNIPLILLWMPEYLPKDKESEQTRQRCSELAKHYASLADNQHVWMIDMHDIDKQRNHFRDPFHCNTVGAIAATDELAKRLLQPEFRRIIESEATKK